MEKANYLSKILIPPKIAKQIEIQKENETKNSIISIFKKRTLFDIETKLKYKEIPPLTILHIILLNI